MNNAAMILQITYSKSKYNLESFNTTKQTYKYLKYKISSIDIPEALLDFPNTIDIIEEAFVDKDIESETPQALKKERYLHLTNIHGQMIYCMCRT